MADNICDCYNTFQALSFTWRYYVFRDVMMREILNLFGDYAEWR